MTKIRHVLQDERVWKLRMRSTTATPTFARASFAPEPVPNCRERLARNARSKKVHRLPGACNLGAVAT